MNLILSGQGVAKLIALYESLVATGAPPAPKKVRQVKNVQVAQVFPFDAFDFLFSGFGKMRGELWLEPGKPFGQEKSPGAGSPPALCGILGPGNIEGLQEPFEQLFAQGNVCIYKSNPVNAHLTDAIYPLVLHRLVDEGYIGFVSGGVETGTVICNHPKVDTLHMVGACGTYDRIVWGPPDQQKERKQKRDKAVAKPFLAELGAVSPWIVVPGADWTASDLEAQARRLVGTKVMNTGHACASPQVIILDKQWSLADKFVTRCRQLLNEYPDLPAYYPGVGKRLENFKKNIPSCEVLHEERGPEGLRTFFIPNVDAEGGNYAVREEAFGPVIAFKFIDGKNDPNLFLEQCVKFCNEEVFGSLSMNITISPDTQAKIDLDSFIYNLRWGSIAINTYAGTVNAIPTLRWGACPGCHDETDIQSGQGGELNSLLIRNPAKTVLHAPFRDPLPLVGPLPSKKTPRIWEALGFAAASNSIFEFLKVPLAMFLPAP